MKLYYSKGACSLVPRIVIHELNLRCDYESVDLGSKKTETGQDFNTVNPKGLVPTLITDDAQTLTENAVILQYLAQTFHGEKLLPEQGFVRYKVLEWLNYVTTELHKGFGPLFNPKLPQDVKDQIFILALKKKFAFLDKHLENQTYLAGNEFTLPDAYLFVMIMWSLHFKFNLSDWPNVSRYFKNLQNRKSIQEALKEESLHTALA